MDFLLIVLFLMSSMLICLFIHTILNALGMLVFGYIDGYKFYAFGFGSYAFVKEDGKIKLKRFGIAGALGYCMMKPPEPKNHQIPYFLYFSGGIIFNILIAIFAILLMIYIPLNDITYYFSMGFAFVGVFFGIQNALPLKFGVGTVGCKILSLYKNNQALKCFYDLYNAELMYIEGKRTKDLSKNIFNIPQNANLNNPIFAEIKILEADYYYDNMEYEIADKIYKSLMSKDIKLIKAQENEILCQLLYFEIIKGNKEEVEKLMTKKLKKYIKATYKNISKKRLMYAYTVLTEEDVEKSDRIWHDFHDATKKNFIKGEIETESEMMDYIGELGIEKGIL